MRDLAELRSELNAIDAGIVRLFERRMAVSREVADRKRQSGMPVLDASREAAVLASRAAMAEDPALDPYIRELFVQIMALSRRLQAQRMQDNEKMKEEK